MKAVAGTWGLSLVCACIAAPGQAAAQAPTQVVPPEVDQAAALRAVLDRAIGAESNGALIEFVARYPDSPLTERARAALAARRAPDARPWPGPDGDIVTAFDRARLSGPAALAAFAADYPNHPLGAEALRPFWQHPR